MSRAHVLLIFLIAILMGILPLSFHVQRVEAMFSTNNEIDINSDGSISNQTAPIETTDNVTYTLTGDINFTSGSNGFVIRRSNIIFEGNGFSVFANAIYGGIGFSLTQMSNVIVQNTTFRGFGFDIAVDQSSDIILRGNNFTNAQYAVWLTSSSANVIDGNCITTNAGRGIELFHSSNNNITRNYIADNHWGIYFESSTGCNVSHNSFINNGIVTGGQTNTWDDGSKGNYWSNYTGVDLNHDGIGDTPFVIDANNIDHYPLMNPMAIPEFPTFLVLPPLMLTTLCGVLICRRRRIPLHSDATSNLS